MNYWLKAKLFLIELASFLSLVMVLVYGLITEYQHFFR